MITNIQLLKNTAHYRKTPKGVLTNIYQHQKARCKKYGYELGYSLKELQALFLNDKKFLILYNQWVIKGYKYYNKPSIDRINADLGYIKKNIQIMNWRENRLKGNKEVAQKKWKPIIMLDMDNVKIKRFNSIKQAVIEMNLNQSLVSMVLAGQRNHTKGYKFIYENSELLTSPKEK